MSKQDEMRTRLTEGLAPDMLEIRDDSEQHRGHAGYDPAGESHFHVTIRSKAFAGQSRIARHRAVHAALGKDLVARIHALSLDIDTP